MNQVNKEKKTPIREYEPEQDPYLSTLYSSEDELSPLPSKFPPPKINDDYETQLSFPVPVGTKISESCLWNKWQCFLNHQKLLNPLINLSTLILC